jgi:hypothetical protein
MEDIRTYEDFPGWMVILSNIVAISIYATGAYILAGFGVFVSILYLLYCLWVEIGILRKSCVYCYYYGKMCGVGKGKLCSLFFKKGDPQRFIEKEITWSAMLPDFMVIIFPMVGGIILLVRDFSLFLLAIMVLLLLLFSGGNAVIRSSLMCKYCKQREIGCPADRLFNKDK